MTSNPALPAQGCKYKTDGGCSHTQGQRLLEEPFTQQLPYCPCASSEIRHQGTTEGLSTWGVKGVASVNPTASKEVLPLNPEARGAPI